LNALATAHTRRRGRPGLASDRLLWSNADHRKRFYGSGRRGDNPAL